MSNKDILLKKKIGTRKTCSDLAGIAGLEPTECRNQNPMPYQLGYIPMTTLGII